MRWRVEISFKRLKSYLNLEKIRNKKVKLWRQNIQSRILLDTIIRTQQKLITQEVEKKKVKAKKNNYVLLILDYIRSICWKEFLQLNYDFNIKTFHVSTSSCN